MSWKPWKAVGNDSVLTGALWWLLHCGVKMRSNWIEVKEKRLISRGNKKKKPKTKYGQGVVARA